MSYIVYSKKEKVGKGYNCYLVGLLPGYLVIKKMQERKEVGACCIRSFSEL